MRVSWSFTFARDPRLTEPVAQLPCGQCRRARVLGLDTGTVVCTTDGCAAAGLHTLVWRALDEAGIDNNPAGAHRPVHGRWPVPWITPVTLDPVGQLRVHWRMIHLRRLATAQRDWLCQHCGLPADPTAAVIFIDEDRRCPTAAPLHPGCARTSARTCPHLAASATAAVVIARSQEQRIGELDEQVGLTQHWHLPPEVRLAPL